MSFHSGKKYKSEVNTLAYTKPCNNVIKKINEETGQLSDYGVCERDVCTFAHSLCQLVLPPCGYGETCNRKYGAKDFRTGKIDTTRKCQFFHPNETIDQFYRRTGYQKPELPETHEKTWNPKSRQIMKEEQEKAISEIAERLEEVKIEPSKKEETFIIPIQVSETLVIRVPHELVEQTLQVVMARCIKDFKIETF